MSHYPTHLASFHHQQHEDVQQGSPASLQTTHSFFADNANNIPGSHNPFVSPIPQYLNHRSETPATSVNGGLGSPSESSQFPSHASHARMHSHRSPSIGGRGVSVSRSRSRSRTSKPPPASRNPMVQKGGAPAAVGGKRQSISSTPEEPVTTTSPPPRPQAIVIPSSHPHPHSHSHSAGHHHEFAAQLNTLGPHPISPLGLHSTQTAPSAWFIPQQGNQSTSVEPSSFTIPSQGNTNDSVHAQSFSSAFNNGATPRSLSLGAVKPGTSASASVLAGSLGTSKDGAPMDAASKQAAILSEKRRRRRESHNAVERRRRDNINEKISELSTLLPECLLDSSGPNGSSAAPIPTTAEDLLPNANSVNVGVAAVDEDGKETAGMKANKGIILRKSVEYIRYLQQLVRVQANRNRDLESQLAHYRGGGTVDSNSGNHSASSPFSGLEAMNGMSMMDDDGMSMSGILANLSPEDTTGYGPGSTNSNGIGGLPNLPESPSEGTNAIGSSMLNHHHHNKSRMDTSPSVGSNEDDEDEEEQARGREPTRHAPSRGGRFSSGGPVVGGVGGASSVGPSAKKTRLRVRNGMLEDAPDDDDDESPLSDGDGASAERMGMNGRGGYPNNQGMDA